MILVGFFTWWYGDGWRGQVSQIRGTLARFSDMFSFSLLLKTFFAPFRQTSADATGNDIGSKFRAWGDRMLSRLIGAFMRFFMIIIGGITMLFVLIFSLFRLILWPILLLMPVIGIILAATVGTPWRFF